MLTPGEGRTRIDLYGPITCRRSNGSTDAVDPREPTARCDRCGASGTIARATRYSEPRLALRYCVTCWPVARTELEARQEEHPRKWRPTPDSAGSTSPAWTVASRSWHDVLHYLDLVSKPPQGASAPGADVLASIASEICATAGEMAGDMPPKVKAFVKRYSTPEA
jgi:hypothetical protein